MSDYKRQTQKGFSLIELIVVITVIAILAAIAVPVYKKYTLTAKMSSVVPALTGIVEKAKVFYSQHGRVPDAYELGFPAVGTGQNTSINDATAADIIGEYYIPGSATAGFGQGLTVYIGGSPGCGIGTNAGIISVYLDAEKLGFDSDVATTAISGFQSNGGVSFWMEYGIVNGTFSVQCVYAYGTESTSGIDNLVPGCVNANLTSSWDWTQFNEWVVWQLPPGQCS